MNMKYEIKPLTEEEETFIEEKINVYGDSMAPSEPHTEEEQLVFKVEDEDKNVIGGCIVSWLFAVVVAWWLAEYVIKDVDMKEDATVKGGGK